MLHPLIGLAMRGVIWYQGEDNLSLIHIWSGEEYEIYFVANQVDSLRTFNASFRIAGRTPELWNAVTGTITRPAQWKELDGRTEVALSLPANGSVFVVFPKESSEVSPERTEREP